MTKVDELIRRLKAAFHQATFLQGQNTPCAKHLFVAIDQGIRDATALADLQAQVAAGEGLAEAGKKLSLMAQTSGGTAGRDDGLVAAIDEFAQALAQWGGKPPCP